MLDIIVKPEFLEHVRKVSLLLKQRLAELKDRHPDVIAEIRGEGLMMGLRLRPEVLNTAFVRAAEAEGLLVIAAGDNVVRLLPPLVIGEAEIAEAYRRLDRAALVARPAASVVATDARETAPLRGAA